MEHFPQKIRFKSRGCHARLRAGTSLLSHKKKENMKHNYYIYILTNIYRTVFYTGITNDLFRRIIEHKIKINEGFTNDYNINRLVHYELFFNINDAIAREKRLKRWNRQWKINLIEKTNPDWKDLAESIGVTPEIVKSARFSLTREGGPRPSRGRQTHCNREVPK